MTSALPVSHLQPQSWLELPSKNQTQDPTRISRQKVTRLMPNNQIREITYLYDQTGRMLTSHGQTINLLA